MARIRTVKPEMAQDEDLAECSMGAQLLAVRILNHADDEGFFKAHPKLIKAACFPLMDSANIPGMLQELSDAEYLRLGTGSDGKDYGQVMNFLKHQRVDKPQPSKIKGLVTFQDYSKKGPRTFNEHSKEEGNGMEGNREQGKEGNSVPNGTGAEAPNLWDVGKKKLGIPGDLIGKWIKQHTEAKVAEAIAAASVKNPADPKAWVSAYLQDRPKNVCPDDPNQIEAWAIANGHPPPKPGESTFDYRKRLSA